MATRPDRYQRWACWFCVAVLAGLAALYTLSLAGLLLEGQVTSFGKGSHRLISFARDPYAFFGDLVAHLLLNGFLWYGAYWIWQTHLRGEHR